MESSSDEAGASSSENVSNIEPLNWTKEEKLQLYFGIKYHRSKGITQIQNDYLPHKTFKEIEEAIDHYFIIARKMIDSTTKKAKIRKKKPKPSIPLASWAKLLTDSMSFRELQTEIATALRIIGDLEHMPSPKRTEQIDFKKVYHRLADTVEGKTLPDNRLISEVLSSCMLDTALVSRKFMKQTSNIISNINLTREFTGFPKLTKDAQTRIIRDLLPQRNYNPLNLTEDSLAFPTE